MNALQHFKKLASSFTDTVEMPHFEKTSFRINKKIFATLHATHQSACLKLSPADQSVYCQVAPGTAYPVNNKWGKQGWTMVNLEDIKINILEEVVTKAYVNTVNKCSP